jgi:hypothetical protein
LGIELGIKSVFNKTKVFNHSLFISSCFFDKEQTYQQDLADNVGYSIKTSYVQNLIDVLPKSIDLPSSTKLTNLPLTEQIKEISKYVVLIKVK